jgi:hypothetical protein
MTAAAMNLLVQVPLDSVNLDLFMRLIRAYMLLSTKSTPRGSANIVIKNQRLQAPINGRRIDIINS